MSSASESWKDFTRPLALVYEIIHRCVGSTRRQTHVDFISTFRGRLTDRSSHNADYDETAWMKFQEPWGERLEV